MFAEVDRHIPFSVRRIFAIYGIGPGRERASHAHRTNRQFIIMLAGSCTIVLDDGKDVWTERLDSPNQGIFVPPLVWVTLKEFTSDAVCLVLASELYDASEYIRDRAEFEQLAESARRPA
jgi:UDP-2-acetamido-3-amino-2,3-dideoxy-glucuronate N-acetyltransferase